MLVLELPRKSGSPSNPTVCAGHIGDDGSRCRGLEAIGPRQHVSDLVSTPAVALDSDGALVNEAFVDHRLNGRQHAVQRALAGEPNGVDDIRLEDEVAVARIVR